MKSSNDVKEFVKNNINTTDEELNRIEKQLNNFAEALPTSIMNNVSVKEVVEEASPEADPEVAPVVKKPKRKYYGKPKATAVKK